MVSEESPYLSHYQGMLRSEDMSVKVVNYLKFCIHNCQVISSKVKVVPYYMIAYGMCLV